MSDKSDMSKQSIAPEQNGTTETGQVTEQNHMLEQFRQQRPVSWEQLPDFALYMDQVLSYMARQTPHFDGDSGLTAAMINNYTKSGLIPRANGKKYDRVHISYLTMISVLKRVFSTRDMEFLFQEENRQGTIQDSYAAFCASLDEALNGTASEMEQRSQENSLSDNAIHFALLSYAAGVASSRYMTLLRQKQSHNDPESETKKRTRKSKTRSENIK